jgi:hypothetical protein
MTNAIVKNIDPAVKVAKASWSRSRLNFTLLYLLKIGLVSCDNVKDFIRVVCFVRIPRRSCSGPYPDNSQCPKSMVSDPVSVPLDGGALGIASASATTPAAT